MSKTTLIAKHRILLKPRPTKYAEPGSRFQIDSKEAKRLVALGAAELAGSAKDEDDVVETVSDDERTAVLVEAIKGLTEEQFDKNGAPKVGEINAALPEGTPKTNSAERDAAWKSMADAEADLI